MTSLSRPRPWLATCVPVTLAALVACTPVTAAQPEGLRVSAAGVKRCAPVRDVIPGVGTNDAIRIRAWRTSCRAARRLPRRFIREMRYGGDGVIGPWTCYGMDHGPWRTTCTASGGRMVIWRLL